MNYALRGHYGNCEPERRITANVFFMNHYEGVGGDLPMYRPSNIVNIQYICNYILKNQTSNLKKGGGTKISFQFVLMRI